jgi:molecular chaperone DnaK
VIETASADLRNALKGTDIEDIKKKTQNLIQSSMKLGEAVYKDQQAAAASPKPEDKKKDNNNEKKDDNVVDADFEEVKDENKEKSA